MKILMVNKFFYKKGGSETYYFELKKLLEQNGHKVIDFSMKDKKNFESKYSDFFIDNIDYDDQKTILQKVILGFKIIYSYESKNKLEKLIKEEKPDIAHLHLFHHQFSSSIVDVLKKYKIPIVYTAHDLKLVCPNYKMLCDGKICEKCKGDKYYNCLIKKCVKKSRIKNLIATLEAYYNKYKKINKKIDKIITPSQFHKTKLIEFGIPEEKIVHIPNFLFPDKLKFKDIKRNNYFFYFGRLSEEKGIFTMLEAFKNTEIVLKIAGIGPLQIEIEDYIKQNKMNNVEILGFKMGEELKTLIKNSKAVIIPSECYENAPYSVIESLETGKILIGSNMGGIPEMINHNVNGYVFENKNIEELRNIIKQVDSFGAKEIEEMEQESRNIFETKYTALNHYQKIIKVYEELIG